MNRGNEFLRPLPRSGVSNNKEEGSTRWSKSSHNVIGTKKIEGVMANRIKATREQYYKGYGGDFDNLSKNEEWVLKNYEDVKEEINAFLKNYSVGTSKLTWLPVENILFFATSDPEKRLGCWRITQEIIQLYSNEYPEGTNSDVLQSAAKSVLQHEVLHSISRNSVFVSIKEGTSLGSVRSGIFTLTSPDNENNKARRYFDVANEGLTELINQSITFNGDLQIYPDEVNLMITIIGSMVNGSIPKEGANTQKREQESHRIFSMFIHTYINNFSKELKKEIRENFGAKALFLLSFLEISDLDNTELNKNVLKFFSITKHDLEKSKDEQEHLHQLIISKIMEYRKRNVA